MGSADDRGLLATAFALSPRRHRSRQRSLAGHEGWTTVLRMLRRQGGPGATLQLDEWGQALLAGCTGAVPLRLLIDCSPPRTAVDRRARRGDAAVDPGGGHARAADPRHELIAATAAPGFGSALRVSARRTAYTAPPPQNSTRPTARPERTEPAESRESSDPAE